MSGIFGILDNKKTNSNISSLLTDMGTIMSHREWYVVDTHADENNGIGLGRIGIGIFNKEKQPVWSEDRAVCVFFSGELYHTSELRHDLVAQGDYLRDDTDAELILRLYQIKGKSFIKQLNGAFLILIWDSHEQQVIITNDRFGLYPLFYAEYNSRFIFSPEMKGILADKTFSKTLDMVALAQYMRFQHLLGERTFFENISLLPSASILIYDLQENSYTIKPYWTVADISYNPHITFEEAVEEAGSLLRKAVHNLSCDHYRPGVYLSGGLDSRILLGLVQCRPVTAITYGRYNCRDVYYARQIAKAVGADLHWFNMEHGHWVNDYVDFFMEMTEGLHPWMHLHGINTLTGARKLIDYNLTGWDGGTIMGHNDSIEPLQVSAVDDNALTVRLFELFNQSYTWPSITEAEENLLYTKSYHQKLQGVAFDSFRDELAKYLHLRPDVRGEHFYLWNHCGRMTQNHIAFKRSHIEVRFPFFDYDLFTFLFSLPAPVRGHRTLYRAVLQKETPRLAYIPYDHDEFLPTTKSWVRGTHSLMVKLKRRINQHVKPIFADHHTLYADYENYLRYELRNWAENILYDKCTIERGIFNPAFVKTLMNRHLSGLEEWTIGKIAPIMTYEMMLRQFYDE